MALIDEEMRVRRSSPQETFGWKIPGISYVIEKAPKELRLSHTDLEMLKKEGEYGINLRHSAGS